MNKLAIIVTIMIGVVVPGVIAWLGDIKPEYKKVSRIFIFAYFAVLYVYSYDFFNDAYAISGLLMWFFLGPVIGATEITNEYLVCVYEARCSNE